jgi:two-component system response regulator HydG
VSNGNTKVLIIDDQAEVRQSMQLFLQTKGFSNVDLAVGPEDGIRKIKEKKYDIVLLDMIMPRISGWGVLAEIGKSKMKQRVTVVSAVGLPQTVADDIAKKYKNVRFLSKNHVVDELVPLMNDMLSSPATLIG